MNAKTTEEVVVDIVCRFTDFTQDLDLDTLLICLFDDEFSHLWTEVTINIEIELDIELECEDIQLDTTLRQLIETVDQKRLVRS